MLEEEALAEQATGIPQEDGGDVHEVIRALLYGIHSS